MKPKLKRFLKIATPIIGASFFTTTIIFVSGAFVSTPTICIGGSTGVLPLVNSFANVYKKADIVTSAGGSGVGISSVLQDLKEIGMASKNPNIVGNVNVDQNKLKAWEEKKIKTITIAWDGIGLIYKTKIDQEIILNEETLAKIYTSFSGLNNITFNDLLNNGNHTIIKPYARNGGATTSGTTDAFWKDSNIDFKSSSYWRSLKKEDIQFIEQALEKGTYGKSVIQTAEANSQAWNRVKNGGEGSMVYLSTGFIMNNLDEIQKAGFKIAKYGSFELSKENITKGYNWFRPLNLLFSIDTIKNNKAILETINWMIFNEKARNIIEVDGYINLTEEQIKSMGYDGSNQFFFVDEKNSDVKLGFSGAKTK